jgi:hypothetical protein
MYSQRMTIQRCRDLIPGHEEYSDEQILEILDSLYSLAQVCLEIAINDLKKGKKLREGRDVYNGIS